MNTFQKYLFISVIFLLANLLGVLVHAQEPQEKPKQQASSITFKLKELIFSGNQILLDEHIQEHVAHYVDQELTFEDLQELTTKIKAFYREKGYVAAYAYLPPQKVNEGIVKVHIVEGIIGEIHWEGNKYFSDEILGEFLNVYPGMVLNYRDLHQGLKAINRYTDLKVKAILKPGENPETTDIEITVKEQKPVHAQVTLNNSGGNTTGRDRLGLNLQFNNVTGRMDQLTTNVQLTERRAIKGISTIYELPIKQGDFTLGLTGSYYDVA